MKLNQQVKKEAPKGGAKQSNGVLEIHSCRVTNGNGLLTKIPRSLGAGIHRFMRHNGSVDQDIKIWRTLGSLSPKRVEVGNVVHFRNCHLFCPKYHRHIIEFDATKEKGRRDGTFCFVHSFSASLTI